MSYSKRHTRTHTHSVIKCKTQLINAEKAIRFCVLFNDGITQYKPFSVWQTEVLHALAVLQLPLPLQSFHPINENKKKKDKETQGNQL